MVRVIASAALLALLVGCTSARTPVATPTSRVEATETPLPTPWPGVTQLSSATPTRRPSVTPWPTRATRRPTLSPRRPSATPRPTCSPYIEGEIDPESFVPFAIVSEEHSFQDYTVRIYDQPLSCVFGQPFEILKGGQRVYAYGCPRARIWSFGATDGPDRQIAVGLDITGDGIPNLVVFEYSGGAHCCGTFHVFELGEEFRKIGSIFCGDYGPHAVKDLDGDGNWEFVVYDTVYWGAWPPLEAPRPQVVLHYAEGTYGVVTELMRRPAPSTAELQSQASEFQSIEDLGYRYTSSLGFAVDLVYTGHADLVEPFLEFLWPDAREERESLVQFLLAQMSNSPYVSDIKAMNTPWPWPEDGRDP